MAGNRHTYQHFGLPSIEEKRNHRAQEAELKKTEKAAKESAKKAAAKENQEKRKKAAETPRPKTKTQENAIEQVIKENTDTENIFSQLDKYLEETNADKINIPYIYSMLDRVDATRGGIIKKPPTIQIVQTLFGNPHNSNKQLPHEPVQLSPQTSAMQENRPVSQQTQKRRR